MRKLKVLFVFIGALSISLAPAQTFQKMTIEEMFELADANSRGIRMFRLAEHTNTATISICQLEHFFNCHLLKGLCRCQRNAQCTDKDK